MRSQPRFREARPVNDLGHLEVDRIEADRRDRLGKPSPAACLERCSRHFELIAEIVPGVDRLAADDGVLALGRRDQVVAAACAHSCSMVAVRPPLRPKNSISRALRSVSDPTASRPRDSSGSTSARLAQLARAVEQLDAELVEFLYQLVVAVIGRAHRLGELHQRGIELFGAEPGLRRGQAIGLQLVGRDVQLLGLLAEIAPAFMPASQTL
jgi:hypothetical protein